MFVPESGSFPYLKHLMCGLPGNSKRALFAFPGGYQSRSLPPSPLLKRASTRRRGINTPTERPFPLGYAKRILNFPFHRAGHGAEGGLARF